jgi:hypothetical protein
MQSEARPYSLVLEDRYTRTRLLRRIWKGICRQSMNTVIEEYTIVSGACPSTIKSRDSLQRTLQYLFTSLFFILGAGFLSSGFFLSCPMSFEELVQNEHFFIQIWSLQYRFCSKTHLLYQMIYILQAIIFFALGYCTMRYSRVSSESIIILPKLGIQYVIVFQNGKSIEQFNFYSDLLDPQVVEAISRYQARYYLAFAFHPNKHSELTRELWSMFMHTYPSLPMLQLIRDAIIKGS